MPMSWPGVMAVENWLPWVLGGVGGVILLERAGVFRGATPGGAEEADRTFPVSLGDRLVPQLLGQLLDRPQGQPAGAATGLDVSALVGQIIAGMGLAFQAAAQPLSVEIPVLDQAVNPFAKVPLRPVSATPAVAEFGGEHDSGPIGALVRRAVTEGFPVPEALLTWVTTNRRGSNPNTSGRNFETHPLQPHERDQVRGAIGMNASVAKELVDAFNAGQGTTGGGGATGVPLVADHLKRLAAELELVRAAVNVPNVMNPLVSGIKEKLESVGIERLTGIGEIFSIGEGSFRRPPFFGSKFLPEFKIPEIITDPGQAVADSLKQAASEAGSELWRSAEPPLTRAFRVTEGTAVATNLAVRGVGKVPVVGPAASAGLKSIPGIGLLSRFAPFAVAADLATSAYELASGESVPILGWGEFIRGILGGGLPRDAEGKVIA